VRSCGAGNQQIDAAASEAGRDPASIRRIINIQGMIGERPRPRGQRSRLATWPVEPLAGPAGWWIETLTGFLEDGFDTIVFWPVDESPGQVEAVRSRRCSTTSASPADLVRAFVQASPSIWSDSSHNRSASNGRPRTGRRRSSRTPLPS